MTDWYLVAREILSPDPWERERVEDLDKRLREMSDEDLEAYLAEINLSGSMK